MQKTLTKLASVSPIILFFLEFVYLAYIHSWEVNPHHDGIMYTAAVGAYEGKVPNKDFFAQYGPVTPIIQGFWFRLSEPTLWSLKLLTSLGLAFIGALIYIGAKRRLSITTSILLSSCWVLTGPFGLPWSSIFSTIFVLVSLLLFESVIRSQFQNKSRLCGFLIGVLLALGVFTRIHVIVVYFAATLALLALKDARKYHQITAVLNVGFFLTFGSIILALVRNQALTAYFDQCILWASGNYAGGPEISLSYFSNLSWIPIFGVVNLLILKLLADRGNMKRFHVFAIVIPVFVLYTVFVFLSQNDRSGPETLRNPRILSIIAGQKAHFSFNFFVLVFFIGLALHKLFLFLKSKDLKSMAINDSRVVYISIALGTITQLYPHTDEYHIAFITPIIIVASIFSLPQDFRIYEYQFAFRYFAIALIPSLVLHSLILANVERSEFNSKTLMGMYGSWHSSKSLDLTMLKLETEQPGIRFVCADGIYAGAGGRYLSIDEKFVTWGPPSVQKRVVDREFICSANQQLISSYLKQGWRVKFKVLLDPMNDFSKTSYWNILFEKFESVPDKEGVH